MAYELKETQHGGVLVLAPHGRLDNESAADFALAAQERLAAGRRHLLIDCSGLNYISNAGLRVLAKLAKALKSPTTSLQLAGMSASIRQVFEAAGFAPMFEIHPDVAAALAKHPAARRDDTRTALVARLLGAEPFTGEIDEAARARARQKGGLILELLAAQAAPRAARAMVEGTQMLPSVRTRDIAGGGKGAAPPGAGAKGSDAPWWKRMFGRD
ncbi:MAG TPA: STAS domain-containing protein [Xanthomonadaceae bacterium]|nr:STAS domain-containing protein [Xanthomonadaceae bacterium]